MIHAAYDMARPPELRAGLHELYAWSAQYVKGWAAAERAAGAPSRTSGAGRCVCPSPAACDLLGCLLARLGLDFGQAGRREISAATAAILRAAHAKATALRKLGEPVPGSVARLESDYTRWRKRIQRGTQAPTTS